MPFWHARELDHRALPSRLRSGYAPGGWAVGAGHPSMVDRTSTHLAADPHPATHNRSAVQAGGDGPGRRLIFVRGPGGTTFRPHHDHRHPCLPAEASGGARRRRWRSPSRRSSRPRASEPTSRCRALRPLNRRPSSPPRKTRIVMQLRRRARYDDGGAQAASRNISDRYDGLCRAMRRPNAAKPARRTKSLSRIRRNGRSTATCSA